MPKKIDKARISFYLSVLGAVFGYGVIVGAYKIFPFELLQYGKQSVEEVFEDREMITRTKPVRHISPSRYEGTGVVTHDPERVMPGLTLLTGFFDDGLELRLIDSSGGIVNRWPVRYSRIWGNLDHLPRGFRPATEWNVVLNGAVVLRDGSVVFNYLGLVKLDRCGEVQWTLPQLSHHSLEPASNGGFWLGGKRYIRGTSKHPPFRPPYEEDTILQVSSDGNVIQEFSVLDLLLENGMRGILYANNRRFRPGPERDVVHLNDVDELTEEVANDFPQFEAGDLLVSIREPNMVFVFDPDTGLIKWYQVGPWIAQHDSDFQKGGRITVFDNNFDGTGSGSIFGGSRVVSVDPQTGETEVLYGGVSHQPMYTSTQGDHQILENGNILMTESNAGRVLEVDAQGEIVWEFINRYSETEVLRTSDAVRYSMDYFTTDQLSCPEGGT